MDSESTKESTTYIPCSASCLGVLDGGSGLGNPSQFKILLVVFVLAYVVMILLIIFVPALQFIRTDLPGLDAILSWTVAALLTIVVHAILAAWKKRQKTLEPHGLCTTTSLWSSLMIGTMITAVGQHIYDRYIEPVAPV
jgi:hypothetical protein